MDDKFEKYKFEAKNNQKYKTKKCKVAQSKFNFFMQFYLLIQ